MVIQIGTTPQAGFDEPIELLMDCHRRVEHFLDTLVRVAEKAPASLPDEYRRALTTARHYFDQAAPRHTEDEEDSLFPRLRASHDPEAKKVLSRLEALEVDHRTARADHQRVDLITDRWLEAGAVDEDSRRELIEVLHRLRRLYTEHIRLEDEEVFPAAQRLLDDQQLQAIGGEMARRRHINIESGP